jgi:RHS repeat-associated protein
MKKLLIPIGTLLFSGLAHAQNQSSSTENYIYSKTYLDYTGTTPTKVSESVQYFDGLGRPKQVVNVKASPSGKDVVTHIEYDGFGRQTLDYLPIPQQGTSGGAIYTSPLSNATQPTLYGAEKIYAEKILENSPLDRILQQKQVGNAWDNKPVQFGYDTNVSNEVYKYTTSTTWENGATKSVLTNSGVYDPNTLYKNSVTDEDGNKTIEFKNGQGQVLLVRKVNAGVEVDTYYVYNEYNQLSYVLPPLAIHKPVTQDLLDNLCYQYKYDGRNRLVEKKLPGKGWEYMVYDKADRLILSRDTVMESQNKWLIKKYDQFGRIAYTGFLTGGNRVGRQNEISNLVITESRNSTGFTRNGIIIYYTENAFVNEIPTILSVNYYDTYPTGTPIIPTQVLGQEVLPQDAQNSAISTKSLPIASYVKNIEDDNWTKNYTWYDKKGRTIGTYSFNHLGGYTKIENLLDFAGVVGRTNTYHLRKQGETEVFITEGFIYDNQNRLLQHYHKVDNNPEVILADNIYNELSQLSNKTVGNNLQSIDYKYNIRGWLTQINDPENLGNKLFGYKIKYQNPDPLLNIQESKYNGNISEVDWKMATDGILKRYTYKYDGLNRLIYGKSYQPYSTNLNIDYYENVEYDNNGNIVALARGKKGIGSSTTTEAIDNLAYTYEGNKLTKITDIAGNTSGYPGGGNIITYDINGNMTSMLDKRIKQIDYNFLNLPNNIQMNVVIGLGYNLSHTYRADGTKLIKQYSKGTTIITTDYLDGFQYEHSSLSPTTPDLKFVPTSEGFYSFENNRYIYQYKDQVGNIRVSFYKSTNGNAEIDDAVDFYPFGLEHGTIATSLSTPSYKYSFQSQEKQVHTGWNSFKWRNYDPSIGRFFNIDPLSEKYSYQSHYNFSENAVISYRELEGLEKIFFQNILFKDERFQKAYQAERQTTGGKEFSNVLSSQNKINVLYTNFSKTNATGIAPLIDSKKEFSEISNDYGLGVHPNEYDKISENGTKKIQVIGMSFGDNSATAFDVAATINHEEVAHGTKTIEKNEEQSNAGDHKSYYGTYTETSPDDKTVLTDKRYEDTKANTNQKELQQILKDPKK